MPEGHVIHRLATELNETFGGAPVHLSSPQGRFTSEVTEILKSDGDGHEVPFDHAEAWGKHLFIHFGTRENPSPHTIHIHLGLIGTFTFEPVDEPRGQVRLRIDNGSVAADLRGPQWCRVIGPVDVDESVGKLGVDPIRPDEGLNHEKLQTTLAKTRRSAKPIGALLMDQSLYAGVGSIYRTEALFRAGVHPLIPGKEVPADQLDEIYADMVDLMRDGVRIGRIDTVRADHTPEAMNREPRADDHGGEVYVYRRTGQPCHICGTPVSLFDLAGRKTYACPTCQPL